MHLQNQAVRCDPAHIFVVCQDDHVKELRKIIEDRE